MKQRILDEISRREDQLSELDAEGHIWWNRFKRLVNDMPDEQIPTIKPGQIFTVEGKMYCITKPKTASEPANDHGHQVLLLSLVE